MSEEVMRYVIDGGLFASEQSYINIRKNNEQSQTIPVGSGPNLTEMVQEISIFDSNGTEHTISPIDSTTQTRDFEISQHVTFDKLPFLRNHVEWKVY